HGPIIDCDIKETIKYYQNFAICKESNEVKVVIVYVSAYGYTKEMAEIIYEEISHNNIACELFDLMETDENIVFGHLVSADVVLYGSATILQDALPPMYNLINRVIAGYHGRKKVSAFGSYGWSGEAVANLLTRLKQQKMQVLDEGLRIVFKPSEKQKTLIREYAQNIIRLK
ncbi:MAG: flavodoxin domain-containing protein, partial [Erysipelotrichaceae bacterium]